MIRGGEFHGAPETGMADFCGIRTAARRARLDASRYFREARHVRPFTPVVAVAGGQ